MTTKDTKPKAPEAPQSDFDVFVVEEQWLTLNDGTEFKVPKLSFRKERLISKLLGDTIGVLAEAGVLGGAANIDLDEPGAVEKFQANTMAMLLNLLFTKVPEKMAEAMSILLSSPDNEITTDWVDENLVSDEIFKFLVPFLVSRREKLSQVLRPYTVALQTMMQEVTTQ